MPKVVTGNYTRNIQRPPAEEAGFTFQAAQVLCLGIAANTQQQAQESIGLCVCI